jgi:hypothetical protein
MPGNTPVTLPTNASGQRIFVLPLVENLDYLILLDHRHACFVAVRGDH